MKVFISAIVILACLAEIVTSWDFISKNCCEPHDDEHLGRICDDGSRAPFIGCCGVGACNIACCNCDGGCITGSNTPHKLLGVWGADITPNLGFSGGSAPVAGSGFVGEAAKTGAKEGGKGVLAIGNAKKNEDDSGIEYHKAN